MSFKNILIAFSLLSSVPAFAEPALEQNTTTETIIEANKTEKLPLDVQRIDQLLVQKETLQKELSDNNIWSKIYSNYHTYKELEKQQIVLDENIARLEKIKRKTQAQKEEYQNAQDTKITLLGKLQLLEEYEKDPFKKFLTPPEITAVPKVDSPFALISAVSYREKLQSDMEEYNNRYESLYHIVEKFKEKQLLLKKLLKLDPLNIEFINEQQDTIDQIKTFIPVLEIFKTTKNVYSKKIDEIELKLKNDIQREIQRTMTIGGIILFFLFILFFIKHFVKKYMSEDERFYAINKALNISFVSILILTLLLAYIENVSYLVTILGFASAGIAIAMKDWFMSLMGWATIVLGGAIHVGDRVRFVREGVEYVGDIVDISMLRMTMHEDVNLTSYMTNRRAGRMIFIPNNFIFTDMIANYSHSGLKTVWDGIDFVITFDSDANKATQIAKEITKKYSKGYTEITRKQLNKLRSKYGMRNTNVEPRIFTHIEPYGLKISAWYLTNSYATMTLRSTISIEIIARIQEEEKIQLAFPTQSIYVDKNVPKPEIGLDTINPPQGL
ncbi:MULTISPECIES: mechanosensitive ion channel domain-containing protein [Sulfurovum]|uniref:Mechanosensitive ion channel n=1 Tax=Sulfurovum xiamenensis TaxID=3019066 RepID=A0ABT7QQS2_9BACT|nr:MULTISPECIES: mechanosensitive ion channel domain-containing protein [Sulfurovum]EIF51730.1 mechanosensitive ion channel [Sulfurovum sp. AR]MDM5263432.1 mechanosensitive ion channel [Sulfurovum xiamenensis]